MRHLLVIAFSAALLLGACVSKPEPPAPFGALPSESQLAWHEMEFYMFVHFNMNTFTDREWGLGDEPATRFNPTQLDCRQWARIAKENGMKGIIITAKHHDGFCLWPSAYTEHSVKNSPWKNGRGDVLRELADACKEQGLKLGVYLSPWDRNHADYGRPEYIDYFRNQLRELLTEYGDVFEVWFDGANGGTGYYGGANEERKVDQKTYYDWPATTALVRELQPDAMIFSDAGPDVRWVGNEEGWANETNWCTLNRDEVWAGFPEYQQLRSGHEDGTHWVPAEADVSIRPGWYYHAADDHKVKSLNQLLDIYYQSVGRNSSLLLNFPVDTRGLIHERDVEQVQKLTATLKADFAKELATGKPAQASQVRGNHPEYAAARANDGDPATYWTTDDSITTASLTIDLGQPTPFNRFVVQEYIRLGQRVQAFTLEARIDGQWKEIAAQTTIGYKRILRLPNTTATHIRLNIVQSKACPLIAHIGLYLAPAVISEPLIRRNKEGRVSIVVPDTSLRVYYTLDGSDPSPTALPYERPFMLKTRGTVKAASFDEKTGKSSPVTQVKFDVCKENWRMVKVTGDALESAGAIIDEDDQTLWQLHAKDPALPHEVVIDLGQRYDLTGFTYLPPQSRYIDGTVVEYELYVSGNGKKWGKPVAAGTFANIKNSPVLQVVAFPRERGRYLRFVALREINDAQRSAIAEIGVISRD